MISSRADSPLYGTKENKTEKQLNGAKLAMWEEQIKPFWIREDLTETEKQHVRHLVTERDLIREVMRLR